MTSTVMVKAPLLTRRRTGLLFVVALAGAAAGISGGVYLVEVAAGTPPWLLPLMTVLFLLLVLLVTHAAFRIAASRCAADREAGNQDPA